MVAVELLKEVPDGHQPRRHPLQELGLPQRRDLHGTMHQVSIAGLPQAVLCQ